jgi:hypothetical protein
LAEHWSNVTNHPEHPHSTRTEDPPAAALRPRERSLAIVTVLVSALLIGFYVVSSSRAARKKERQREQSAVEAQRKVVEQARDRRARAMMQRPSWEAARRAVQDLTDKGMVHTYDFDAGTLRVNQPAWSALKVEDKQATARLFWVACTPLDGGDPPAVRILSHLDETLLAEYDPRNGAIVLSP